MTETTTHSPAAPAGVDLHQARRQRPDWAAAGAADRSPPHSPEAERGVLACILLAPSETMSDCLGKLRVSAALFYDLRHQTLFEVLREMFERNEPIDLITLQQRLKDRNLLDKVGGLTYLTGLPDAAPSAANLKFYLEIVKEKYVLRNLLRTCGDIMARVQRHAGDVDELLDSVERDILHISETRVEQGAVEIRELVKKAINTVEDFHKRQGMLTGISTGFVDLDRMTYGLHQGEMIVIAARPSVGKTSLAMNIAEHVAVDQKLPVAVFSLEMTGEALALRMLCSRARVNLRNAREGFLAERDFPKLTDAAGRLAGAPLYIDDSSGLSILQLRARARRLEQQYKIRLFVVDYLQLLHSTSRRAENRQQEIADISSGLKALAKELKVPVIVLSQLNRELERDKNRKPRLSDLRESGAIEQDADVVGLLYRPSSDEDESSGPESDAVPINLLIAKQRNGPTGEIPLTFLKPYTRFESAARSGGEDLS